MHQVPADITGEHATDILFGKRVAIIQRAAGCGGEPAGHLFGDIQLVFVIPLLAKSGALLPPLLRTREGIHVGRWTPVIGGISG